MYLRMRRTINTHTFFLPHLLLLFLFSSSTMMMKGNIGVYADILTSCTTLDNTQSNKVFYMNGDIYSSSSSSICIHVEGAYNVTLEGNGYRVVCDPQVYDCDTGIEVRASYNITVRNFKITGSRTGISFFGVTNASVLSNEIYSTPLNTSNNINTTVSVVSGTYFGILIQSQCAQFVVRDNVIHHLTSMQTGLDVYGMDIIGVNHIITNNSVHHLQSTCCTNGAILGLAFGSCTDCIISDNYISDLHPAGCNSSSGLYMWGMWTADMSGSLFSRNTVQNLFTSGQNTAVGQETVMGILLQDSDNVTFEQNNVQNITGTSLDSVNSTLGRCMYGIKLEGSSNCFFSGNTISDMSCGAQVCGVYGIHISGGVNITSQQASITDIFGSADNTTADTPYSYYLDDAYDVSVLDNTLSSPTFPATATCLVGGYEVDVSSNACNAFILQNISALVMCRAANGECDVAEYLLFNGTCPQDSYKSSSDVCREYSLCGHVQFCSGNDSECPYVDALPMECTCGNMQCDNGEDCNLCYVDCFSSNCDVCGDKICSASENCTTCSTFCISDCAQDHPCSPSCEHGTCEKGECVCEGEWSGITCSEVPVNISIYTSQSTPSINITIPLSGQKIVLYVSEISEYDEDGLKTNNTYTSDDITFSVAEQQGLNISAGNDSSIVQTWTYSAVLKNEASLTIKISFFESNATLEFANQTINIPPHTVKFNIRVDSWPFMTYYNTLTVVLKAEGDFKMDNDQNACSQSQQIGGSVAWNRILLGQYELYGRFHEYAYLDGITRAVNFVVNNSNPGELRILSPHFWDYVEIDPDYSVLVSDNKGSQHTSNSMGAGCYADDGGDAHKRKKSMRIAVITCVGVVLVCSVVVAVVISVIRKKKLKEEKDRLSARIASMNLDSTTNLMNANIDVSL